MQVWSAVESKDVGWSRSAHGGLYIFQHHLDFTQLVAGSNIMIKWHLLHISKPLIFAIRITFALPHTVLCFNILSDIILASDSIISVNLTNIIEHVLDS